MHDIYRYQTNALRYSRCATLATKRREFFSASNSRIRYIYKRFNVLSHLSPVLGCVTLSFPSGFKTRQTRDCDGILWREAVPALYVHQITSPVPVMPYMLLQRSCVITQGSAISIVLVVLSFRIFGFSALYAVLGVFV